jgi:hypothetical protein
MPVEHIRLTAEQESTLKLWLDEKIQEIIDRREQRTVDWRRWREAYEGKTKAKSFPWRNASNVWVPITSIITDAIHANMMNRIFGHKRVWDVEAVRPEEKVGINPEDNQPITWSTLADAVSDFFSAQATPTGMLDIYEPCEDAILECIKLGTAVLFNPWVTDTQTDFTYDPETGNIARNVPVTTFDGLRPEHLPLEDFLISPNYPDILGPKAAPIFGHMYYLREGQMNTRRESGIFRNIKSATRKEEWDNILATPGGPEEALKDAQAYSENEVHTVTDSRRDDFLLQDLWIKYQLYEDGPEYHLFVTRHHLTGNLLAVRPWPYKTPPYVVFRYIRREGRFYGIGASEMLESIQRGINTSFNQTVDNATLANTRAFKVKKGSSAARHLGDIYPGKKFLLERMEDLEEFQLGEIYPSAFQVGLEFWGFGEKRAGVSDYNLGRESSALGKQSTATTTLALIQENARRFDLYSKDIRRSLGELGMQSAELIQQMKPDGVIFSTMGDKAQLVVAALGQPSHVNLREHLRIVATSSSRDSSKELARQNALTAFSLLVQYLEKLFVSAQAISNPMVPESLRKLAYDMTQTAERLMQRVLEGFELEDIAAFLPQVEKVVSDGPRETAQLMQQQAAMGGAPGASGGGEGAPPGPSPGAGG